MEKIGFGGAVRDGGAALTMIKRMFGLLAASTAAPRAHVSARKAPSLWKIISVCRLKFSSGFKFYSGFTEKRTMSHQKVSGAKFKNEVSRPNPPQPPHTPNAWEWLRRPQHTHTNRRAPIGVPPGARSLRRARWCVGVATKFCSHLPADFFSVSHFQGRGMVLWGPWGSIEHRGRWCTP